MRVCVGGYVLNQSLENLPGFEISFGMIKCQDMIIKLGAGSTVRSRLVEIGSEA